jgi:hypothetical protein
MGGGRGWGKETAWRNNPNNICTDESMIITKRNKNIIK